MSVEELKMFRQMHGNILNDQIKNYNIQGKLGVTPKKIK